MITDLLHEQHALVAQFDSLNGQPLLIPSLKSIHPDWVVEKHPEYERLQVHLRDWWNRRWATDPRMCKMLEHLNPALWVSFGYPRTSFDKLLTTGKCLAWVFVWDDHLDDGKFTYDMPGALQYINETLSFMNSCFDPNTDLLTLNHSDPAIDSIKDFVSDVRLYPLTASRFHKELELYILATMDCHKQREISDVVSLKEYMARRTISCGCYPYMVLHEYAADISVPNQWWMTSNQYMATIWANAAILVYVTNDIMSLVKELAADQFESMIPLTMYHGHLSVQAATDSTSQLLRDAAAEIDKAEKALYAQVDAVNLPAVQKLVLGVKHIALCCMNHPYSAKRYLRDSVMQEDGSLLYKLQISTHGPKTVEVVDEKTVLCNAPIAEQEWKVGQDVTAM